jgi:magnesium chelatase family protein
LIDRIDLCVEAPVVQYEELTRRGQNESSATIKQRVAKCQQIQSKRYENENFYHNSQIPASKISEYCPLGKKEESFMESVYKKESLTARTYHKILRVARTIADMEQSSQIQLHHLVEAVCYRSIDQRYWGGR